MSLLGSFARILAFATLTAATTGTAFAQPTSDAYPEKPIKIVVPYTAGGFNDTMARVFGKVLQDNWGKPVIVENRPGAGTVIGTDVGAKAAPDGYTLLVVGFPLSVNQFLYRKLPYDTTRDFTPIMLGGKTPNLLVVNSKSEIRTLADFVAAAKANPGKINYASAGKGTSLHLAMEYFKSVAGIDVTHVPYRGSSPMVTDLLGGQVDIMFDNLPNALPHVTAGTMRALGVTTKQRVAERPDIPTIAEQNYPGFEIDVWYALAAPAGTPKVIVDKLNAELNKALRSKTVKEAFAAQGVEPLGGTPEDMAAYFKAQDEKWSKVIKGANIEAD